MFGSHDEIAEMDRCSPHLFGFGKCVRLSCMTHVSQCMHILNVLMVHSSSIVSTFLAENDKQFEWNNTLMTKGSPANHGFVHLVCVIKMDQTKRNLLRNQCSGNVTARAITAFGTSLDAVGQEIPSYGQGQMSDQRFKIMSGSDKCFWWINKFLKF